MTNDAGGVASGDAEGSVRRMRAAGLPGGEAADSAHALSPHLLPVRSLPQSADAGQLLRDRGGAVLLRDVSGRGGRPAARVHHRRVDVRRRGTEGAAEVPQRRGKDAEKGQFRSSPNERRRGKGKINFSRNFSVRRMRGAGWRTPPCPT